MSKLCNICGKEIPEDEDILVDGQTMCHDCFDDLYAVCDCCGAFQLRASMTTTGEGDLVCGDCIEREYVRCENCGELVHVDHTRTVNEFLRDEMVVCDSCCDLDDYFVCSDCENTYSWSHLSMRDDYRCICDGCSDNWNVCDDCGAVIHVDDTYYVDEDDDVSYCCDCVDEHRRGNGGINDYGFKPDPVFGTTDSKDGTHFYTGKDLTFGVELECDKGSNPSSTAREITGLTDRVYCKHDGSLDYGYEVVTHPGTLAWHMNSFPWQKIVSVSIENGFKSHDAKTCGLHIHIGRGQLGDNGEERIGTIAKMIVLMNTLWPEFCRFSRRNGDMHWCHLNTGLSELQPGMTEEEAARKLYDDSRFQGRYVAVNVQNSQTVELRFNRGTLKLGTIFACLQLASNYTLFAKEHTMNECFEAKWEDIVHYREYDELTTYVSTRFSNWVADDCERSTTNFRVGQTAPEPTKSAFLERAHLVAMGAELAPENTVPELGDLVVLTRQYSATSGPAVGSIGVVVGFNSFGHPGVYWNDTEFIGHNDCCEDLSLGGDRQWFVNCGIIRVIRSYRNGAHSDRTYNLNLLRKHGLMPGDEVRHGGRPATILYPRSMIEVALSIHNFNDGHSAGRMVSNSSGWFVPSSTLYKN